MESASRSFMMIVSEFSEFRKIPNFIPVMTWSDVFNSVLNTMFTDGPKILKSAGAPNPVIF